MFIYSNASRVMNTALQQIKSFKPILLLDLSKSKGLSRAALTPFLLRMQPAVGSCKTIQDWYRFDFYSA
jgi:hypothetical protein